MMKLGVTALYKKSRPSSNLGVIAPWVRTPKMWRWAATLGKLAHKLSIIAGWNLCLIARASPLLRQNTDSRLTSTDDTASSG